MNILDEDVLDLKSLPAELPPKAGQRIAVSTGYRWCMNGVRAFNGEKVRLEHVRLGRRILTSRQAIRRFSQRLAQTAQKDTLVAPIIPSNRSRHKERAAAAEEAGSI